ncbi:hypothetical protein ACFQ48_18670 [Hymenobacter caeli]|uniref:Uncharacterized protein n=1 Tax=Hymenobacter caeli TaxID=2735894 RepID=A0ABX2FW07_9BACT|nr:hypothetical protein [Hymenobacter caeli]NRT20973.1 hypothetical protein [Hymenobacter caeli]
MNPARIELTLSASGRHLAFSKELLDVAHVFRRVGGEGKPWVRLAVYARSPYFDTDAFAPGTQLEYYVQHDTQQGEEEARSHIVSTSTGLL